MTTASYREVKEYSNQMWPWLVLYNNRRRFAKLGYHDSLKELDAYTADIFSIIDRQVSKLDEEEMKRKK